MATLKFRKGAEWVTVTDPEAAKKTDLNGYMPKAVYDTDNDGKVDAAEVADRTAELSDEYGIVKITTDGVETKFIGKEGTNGFKFYTNGDSTTPKFSVGNDEILVNADIDIADGYQVNGTVAKAIADANGNNIESTYAKKTDIPEALADLTDDSTHRTVTDTEKATWNAKSDFNGDYNNLINKPDLIVPAEENLDQSIAYIKNVPENSVPSAEVTKLGGMTRKCTNLFNPSNISTSAQYATVSLSNNDVIIEGTYYASFSINLKANVQYTISFDATQTIRNQVTLKYKSGALSQALLPQKSFTPIEDVVEIYLYAGDGNVGKTVYSNLIINKGSSALPYEPYFEGLRSVPVTEVESIGVNIWDEEWYNAALNTNNGVFSEGDNLNVSSKNYISVKPNTDYYFSLRPYVACYDNKKTFIMSNRPTADGKVFTTPENCHFIKFQTVLSSYGTTYKNDIIISKGTTALPYTPFTRNTLPIPSYVPMHLTYGIKIGDVYDSIDWKNKQYIQRVGKVDMGTLDWVYTNAYGTGVMCFKAASPENAKLVGATDAPNVLCALFNSITANSMSTGVEGITSFASLNGILVCDSRYTDAATFKAAMSGVMLYYELAEPVTTEVPPELKALDGYGWGINENCYNYIDFEKKQFVKRVEKVDLGELSWNYLTATSSRSALFYNDSLKDIVYSPNYLKKNNILCAALIEVATANHSSVDRSISINNEGRIYIRYDAYTDAATLRSAVSGVILCYELAEPIITDISNILPDGYIGVEGNGTLTFVNKYGYDVPSDIVFYTGNNEVVGANKFVGDLAGTASRAMADEQGRNIANIYATKDEIAEANYAKKADLPSQYITLDQANRIAIPANSDLNTIKTPGNYAIYSSSDATTLSNIPDGLTKAFRMTVGYCTIQASTYLYQELTEYAKGNTWYRYTANGGTSWQPWVLNIDSSNIGSQTVAKAANSPMLSAYVQRPASANISQTGDGSVKHLLSTASMTEGKPIADGNILHFEWDNTGGYSKQLFIPHQSNVPMQYRCMNSGTWSDWITLINSANIGSQSVNQATSAYELQSKPEDYTATATLKMFDNQATKLTIPNGMDGFEVYTNGDTTTPMMQVGINEVTVKKLKVTEPWTLVGITDNQTNSTDNRFKEFYYSSNAKELMIMGYVTDDSDPKLYIQQHILIPTISHQSRLYTQDIPVTRFQSTTNFATAIFRLDMSEGFIKLDSCSFSSGASLNYACLYVYER